MQTPLVLTVLGRDRTGLVESLARLVMEHDGNWLESRMCRLGGEFAGILRLRLPEERRTAFLISLDALKEQGLAITVRPDLIEPADVPSKNLMNLELVGQDRPGIVRQMTAALARRGVNVEELSTECSSAPMSGEWLFRAQAKVLVPESCDVQMLQTDLERIAADLMVDLRLAPVG
jgi:glycine cleavage system regulatory protein